MDYENLHKICIKLDSICKEFHPNITCRVSELIVEYENICEQNAIDDKEINVHDKVYVYIQIPKDIADENLSIEELRDRIESFKYVARVFIEICS